MELPVDENLLKTAVETVGPIAVGIDADHLSFTLYKGGIYIEPKCDPDSLTHAVLVVGQHHKPDFNIHKSLLYFKEYFYIFERLRYRKRTRLLDF